MLNYILMGLSSYVVVCAIVQAIITFRFLTVLRAPVASPRGPRLPKAAIILAIRGSDPGLMRNIRALLSQSYPDFKLFVVIDHVEDPARKTVERASKEAPELIHVSFLKEPLRTCSLKCSAIIQVLGELDTSYEIVAFVDSDTLVHRTWLRELVGPLSDPSVGASTGNRWYLPRDNSFGSMTRYFWNVGVVIQLWLNEFVWPGSMALRRDALDKMGLAAALRTSLFDGPAVVRQIRRSGYTVRFVPTAMIANLESISLKDFVSWIERQTVVLGSAEKYNWHLLAMNAFHVAICVFAPPVSAVIALWSSEWAVLRWTLFAMTSYWFVMSLSVLAIERGVRRLLILNRSALRWFDWRSAASAAPSILLAHLVPIWALVRAANRTTVQWRGIKYEIRGPGEVNMLSYEPFREARKAGESIL